MNAPANLQSWLALAVVAVTAGLLAWSWWRRRGRHDGCGGCGVAGGSREWRALKRRLRR